MVCITKSILLYVLNGQEVFYCWSEAVRVQSSCRFLDDDDHDSVVIS